MKTNRVPNWVHPVEMVEEALEDELNVNVYSERVGSYSRNREDYHVYRRFYPYHQCPHCDSWSLTILMTKEHPHKDQDYYILFRECEHCMYRDFDVEIEVAEEAFS